MVRYVITISLLFGSIYGQCDDLEIELWGECFNIDSTYEIDLSGQQLSGSIPSDIQ